MDRTKSCSIGGACGTGFVGLLCPLCIPAIAGFLSSLGLGFLATKAVIWPLLGLFSFLFILGLAWGYRQHRNAGPLLIGIAGTLAIPAGNYVVMARLLTYIGAAIAIAAAIWNIVLRMRCRQCA